MAQTRSMCQFCEESPEIKWKCINCELLLCQLCCSKIHRKSKASLEHEIINIKDIEKLNFSYSVRKVDLENLVCTNHSKRKCFVYCNECSLPACSKCLTETHKMHDYISLDERHDEIILEMKELIKNFESNLQFLRYEKDKLQKVLIDSDTNFLKTRKIILQTEKEMKEAITKNAIDLLQELDAKWKPTKNVIKTELSVMTQNEVELETRKNDLNQALQSHYVDEIFYTNKNLDKSLPFKNSVQKLKSNKTKFIPGNVQSKTESQSMLGDLYTIPDFELVDTFQINNTGVPIILSCNDNSAFIGSRSGEKLQKVKFENHEIKVEQEIQIKVNDMARTQDGELLVSTEESDIKLYNKDNKFKRSTDFSPLKPSCVHVDKDNRIIVGLVEPFAVVFIRPSNDSIRRLVVMNRDGDIQHKIEHDKDNHKLLTFPSRISTFKSKILVVDIINDDTHGRVVMLDYGALLHWTYTGCKSINSNPDKFYPRDVSISSTDMILVSDCLNHAIHVLNQHGEVFVCKEVKILGIEFPSSLDIDKTDVLWIGCNTRATDKSKKAKIHCVKLY
ncbi:E3 ubiquitin-protein ligase TRIM71-like [Mytilus trossulus]|uniref:E3 ubiquitin-protein ligase TRIM71-like n=1 Tax=Mytilus trossulus TaxID=6551 RepID=UPI0030044904